MSSAILVRSLFIAGACVGLSVVMVVTMVPMLGGTLDRSAWVPAIICPLLMAFPISAYLLSQNERLRQARDEVARLHLELTRAHGKLAYQAVRDAMTDMLNRDAFLRETDRRLCEGGGVLLLLDIDHFKQVNDRFGHPTGDAALIAVAGTIHLQLRKLDLCGRLGGEEFGVYLPDTTLTEARRVAERLRIAVAACDVRAEDETRLGLTVSIGGAGLIDGESLSRLVSRADEHLYEAKRSGRNRVVVPS